MTRKRQNGMMDERKNENKQNCYRIVCVESKKIIRLLSCAGHKKIITHIIAILLKIFAIPHKIDSFSFLSHSNLHFPIHKHHDDVFNVFFFLVFFPFRSTSICSVINRNVSCSVKQNIYMQAYLYIYIREMRK